MQAQVNRATYSGFAQQDDAAPEGEDSSRMAGGPPVVWLRIKALQPTVPTATAATRGPQARPSLTCS